MELGAIVVLGLDVGEEILDGLRRCIGGELDPDLAGGGVEIDLRIRLTRAALSERDATARIVPARERATTVGRTGSSSRNQP